MNFEKFGFKRKPKLEFKSPSSSQETRCSEKALSNYRIPKIVSNNATVDDAEERLRYAISHGCGKAKPNSSSSSRHFNDSTDSKVSISKQERKDYQRNMTETSILSSYERSAASYSGFKAKRRKASFMEDCEDDDSENIRPVKKRQLSNSASVNKEVIYCDDNNDDVVVVKCANDVSSVEKNRESDTEKLKEIYSELSTEEAENALSLSGGSLPDAILNLSGKIVNEDKKDAVKKAKSAKPLQSDLVEYETLSSDSENEECHEMSHSQMTVWSFFQNSSLADISVVPGCSEKKAKEIIKLRPFEDYFDLKNKLNGIKGTTTKLLEDCLDFIKEQNEINKLMKKCESISHRIEAAIEQESTPDKKDDDDVVNLSRIPLTKQPGILNKKFSLKHYQLTGLNWLITLHKEGVNGILADQMGLGKTIQALAFIGYLIENGHPGPHVIVVPSSTCDNWIREIETWLPTVQYIYYRGSQEERSLLREDILYGDEEFNIILCTYNIATSTPRDRSLFRKLNCHYLVLDEGHMLKNMKSQRYQNLMEMKSKRRLLLTGTPIQNNLLELMSLLSFVMPDLFEERIAGINMLFGTKKKSSSSLEKSTLEAAKNILKPFILRRLKEDVLRDLPDKEEKLIKCDVTQKQRVFYDAVVAQYRSSVGQKIDYSSAVGFLMKLRKTANHPLLERNLYDKDLLSKMARDYVKQLENRESTFELVLEDMEVMSDFELHSLCCEKYYLSKYRLQTEAIVSSGKFKQLDALLPQLKDKGSRVLLFSQFTSMLDIIEIYMKHLHYKFLRLDGQTPVSERLSLIDKYNNDDNIFVFLLSTKAGGLGINLTSANVVILHDIDFNPYNDKQAEDRCHRVGQQRNVTIYKLISKDTIEEGILKCANNKLALEKNIAGTHAKDDDSASEEVVSYLMGNL
eukprot:gene180-793_t